MYGVWLGRLPSVSNLPNAANQFAPAYGLRLMASPLRCLSADCHYR